MRSWRTSGSVGRAPGNRCLYPEADCQEPTLRFGPWQQLKPSVHHPSDHTAARSGRPPRRYAVRCPTRSSPICACG
jgi:hypothetical protein